MGKYIAIYIRVSSRERALFGYGLDAQLEKIKGYIKLFDKSLENVRVFSDEGISGANTNRPALQELLKEVKKGEVSELYIYKLDRLARNVVDVYNIIKLLMEHNCRLYAILDQLDIYSANGRMLVGILAIIAQWEREVIQERTLDGMEAMVLKGKYPFGNRPYGWNKSSENYITINVEESGILNYIADLLIQGYSLNDVTRFLYEDYKLTVNPERIKNWMRRKINYGVFEYHGKIYENIVPAIMSEKKFYEVESALDRREIEWDIDKYIYSNLVYCLCGERTRHKVTIKKTKQYLYYMCEKCKKRINQNILIDQTLSEIIIHSERKRKKVLTNKTEKRLISINKKMNKLYEEYEKNLIDSKTYAYTLSNLMLTKDKIKQELILWEDMKRKEWSEMTEKERSKFIHTYTGKIIVDMDLHMVLSLTFKTKY